VTVRDVDAVLVVGDEFGGETVGGDRSSERDGEEDGDGVHAAFLPRARAFALSRALTHRGQPALVPAMSFAQSVRYAAGNFSPHAQTQSHLRAEGSP
jgi:hypothetical protein